jgi:hypothetical protein
MDPPAAVRSRAMDLRARWPAARAALIAVAIALALVDGCPIPDRRITPQWAHGITGALDDARTAVRRPVAGVVKDLDITQRWILFRGASRKRFRLYLEGQTAAGEWQLLHRAGDPEHAEYEDLLAYRRVRGTYSPSGQNARGQYRPFATWMTLRALDDHPEFSVARTRMEKVQIGEGGYTPIGEFTLEIQERRRRK